MQTQGRKCVGERVLPLPLPYFVLSNLPFRESRSRTGQDAENLWVRVSLEKEGLGGVKVRKLFDSDSLVVFTDTPVGLG